MDAAILDAFNLPRGYWEAKDEKDDLKAEMNKKFAASLFAILAIKLDFESRKIVDAKILASEAHLRWQPILLTVINSVQGLRG